MTAHNDKRLLEDIIGSALIEFDEWLQRSKWTGKENDCVNQFAHGFLAKKVTSGGVLHDLTQIGIEVGVPQPPRWGIKKGVRRDLVIWGNPRMTTFDKDFQPVHVPIAIVEWKARKRDLSKRDLHWLARFTGAHPRCFGAAVTVDFNSPGSRLHAAAVRAGTVDVGWLRVR